VSRESPADAARPSALALALALAPGTLFAGMAGGIVFPIFPIVGKHVGLAPWFIGLILAANRAMRVVCAPFIGMLADRIGGRRTLLLGLVIQLGVIGLYILGLVTHHEGAGFLLGRLLHGPGSACVFVSAQALALQAGGPAHGGSTAGTVRAAIVLGVPIGLVVGGLLSGPLGNTATFGVAGVAVVIALVAGFFTIPDLRGKLAKRPSAWVALKAMRDRRLLAVGSLNFGLGFAAGGMLLTTLALVVDTRHLTIFGRDSEGTSGILMGLMSITDATFTPMLGRVGDRLHAHAKVAIWSLVVMAAGLIAIGCASGLVLTCAGIVAVGLGCAGLGPSVLVLMGLIVPAEQRGLGTGLLQLCGDAGGMLGPLVGTALLEGAILVPYLLTAGLVLALVPVARSLRRVERAAEGAAA
jgi:MFS family permease